ncbi:SCO3242 family prenyltransferase [Streptomyces sp. NPDC059491]|uniref:SCO3242 family prenyltransferase n=1 Tax=Streptomyces sp. NPDC059491 TaxID=3346850 RepID=UPI0036B5BCF7
MSGALSPPSPRLTAWAELLRVSALASVPGDALAGAAAAGRRPGRGTAWAAGASLCLYEAGMALNDWADRDVDAVERPHRPLPSGRIAPAAALGAAGALTVAGLALASRAGRPALAVAGGLAATVWAYDLHLKHTPAGPAAMAAARGLDLLLGAVATPPLAPAPTTAVRTSGVTLANAPQHVRAAATETLRCEKPRPSTCHATAVPLRAPTAPPTAGPEAGGRHTIASLRAAAPAAAALAAHTYAVTAVSRHEAHGGSTAVPLTALAMTTALGVLTTWSQPVRTPYRDAAPPLLSRPDRPGGQRTRTVPAPSARPVGEPPRAVPRYSAAIHRLERAAAPSVTGLLAGAYLRTAARPLLHAALNPSPYLTRRAVGGGIRAMIPLQAALAARSGAPFAGLAVLGLAPVARRLARKVSPT